MPAAETEIVVRLARIEEKVDAIKTDNARGEIVHADFEQRLRRLERWMFVLTGAAATLGSSAGVVVSKLVGA